MDGLRAHYSTLVFSSVDMVLPMSWNGHYSWEGVL